MAVIGICTSADESNIKALISELQSSTASDRSAAIIKFVELPYNDLDSFRLKSKELDGLILCHSINNRRFAITDVLDALYDTFLPHAKQVVGKENICVIAHDFPWPMTGESSGRQRSRSPERVHALTKVARMNGFRSSQPTVFECCSLAMLCGRLDVDDTGEGKVQMDADDRELLNSFVAKFSYPRGTVADRQSVGTPITMPTVGIFMTGKECDIEALIARIRAEININIKFVELPYNDLDSYHLNPASLDGLILYHSINNRRFSITDVRDALYNVFLHQAKRVFGKENVFVVVSDFPWPMGTGDNHARIKAARMLNFHRDQPTTFECCEGAILCGKLDTELHRGEVDEEDWQLLKEFMQQLKHRPKRSREWLLIITGIEVVCVLILLASRPARRFLMGRVYALVSMPAILAQYGAKFLMGWVHALASIPAVLAQYGAKFVKGNIYALACIPAVLAQYGAKSLMGWVHALASIPAVLAQCGAKSLMRRVHALIPTVAFQAFADCINLPYRAMAVVLAGLEYPVTYARLFFGYVSYFTTHYLGF